MNKYRVEVKGITSDHHIKVYVNAAMSAASMNRAYNKANELAIREFEHAGHTVLALSSIKIDVVDWGD